MPNEMLTAVGMVSIFPQIAAIPNIEHVRVFSSLVPAVRFQHTNGCIGFAPIMLFDACGADDLEKVRKTLHQKIDQVFDEATKILRAAGCQDTSAN